VTFLVPQQMYDKHDEYAKKVKSEMEESKRMTAIPVGDLTKREKEDAVRAGHDVSGTHLITTSDDLGGILNSYSKPNVKVSERTIKRRGKSDLTITKYAPASDVDLSVYDTEIGAFGDNTIVHGWVAPPPEYGVDPVAYHRLERTARVGGYGFMASAATVLIQGLVQTPHLIETYATGAQWAIEFGGPHALILGPALSIAAVAKARLISMKKRTDDQPVPLRTLRGSQIRKMKAIHRARKPEHAQALTRQVYEQAVTQEAAYQQRRAAEETQRKVAAKAAREQAITKERAAQMVREAFDEESAKRLAEQAERLAVTRAAEEAAARAAAALENALATATERHERIRTAYVDIITDPLNALEHASLFDVGDTRTSKFVQAYLDVEDLVNNHGGVVPTDLISSYADQVRDLVRLWDDALAYSTKRSYTWLPHGEADIARKAAAALARAIPADGEEITPEQIISARKALDLLDKITTVTLPKQARGAIQAVSRLEITAGSGE
jgi:hypothetical protein